MNNTIKLINIYWAAATISNELFLKHKKEMRIMVIFNKIVNKYDELKCSVENKIFSLGSNWHNDILDIAEKDLSKRDIYCEISRDINNPYFKDNVFPYVTEFLGEYELQTV